MRHSISLLLAAMLALFISSMARAEALEVTTTPAAITAKRGQVVPVSVNLKNALPTSEPIALSAQVDWEDEYGVAKTATASTNISMVQPVKINRYKVTIPLFLLLWLVLRN
ncbi:MAG: hypothetical protein ACYC64_09790 [Armatimonadota bacterium]